MHVFSWNQWTEAAIGHDTMNRSIAAFQKQHVRHNKHSVLLISQKKPKKPKYLQSES